MASRKLSLSDAYGISSNAAWVWSASVFMLIPLSVAVMGGLSYKVGLAAFPLSIIVALLGLPVAMAVSILFVVPWVYLTQRLDERYRVIWSLIFSVTVGAMVSFFISYYLIRWEHAVFAMTTGGALSGLAIALSLKKAMDFRGHISIDLESRRRGLFLPGWVSKRRKEW